jgi:A/G-specific adenine glycosylase
MQRAFPEDVVASIRTALLEFFDASARALPWRGSGDPYRILVSEVMAQQTRIETVIPYYQRWLERFPDVAALAEAEEDDVLREWAGLGYYGRARNLHAAARLMRERYAGAVPSTYDDLRALPGVGDYTAGAVASIAFGVAAPAVDGNVRRVLSRLLDDPNPSAGTLRGCAGALVPCRRPGDFNQALMELGSRICTPRAPRCGTCPLHEYCAARAAGTQHERPAPKASKAIPTFDLVTAIMRAADGRVLLVRRPRHGLLAGMWNFPASEVAPDAAAAAAAATGGTAAVATAVGGMVAAQLPGAGSGLPRFVGAVEHTFSHRRERYHCFVVDVVDAPPLTAGQAWAGDDASAWALPRAQRRIHDLYLDDAATEAA